jgi:hypothetical protein
MRCLLQGRAESAAEVARLRERLRMGDEELARRERQYGANEAARAAEIEQVRVRARAKGRARFRADLAS